MAHIQMSFYSNALKKNANVMIFLPTQDADDYLFGSGNAKYDPDKKYQTLYLLHGSYGDCMDWGRLASVERYAQQYGIDPNDGSFPKPDAYCAGYGGPSCR